MENIELKPSVNEGLIDKCILFKDYSSRHEKYVCGIELFGDEHTKILRYLINTTSFYEKSDCETEIRDYFFENKSSYVIIFPSAKTYRNVLERFIGLLSHEVNVEKLEAAEDHAAQVFHNAWLKAQAAGGCKRITSFIRNRSRGIYTRRQLRQIFVLDCQNREIINAEQKANEAVKNLLKTSSGFKAQLYTWSDAINYRDKLIDEVKLWMQNEAHKM